LKTGVPQIGFDLVKHTDGNLRFGSQWKQAKVLDGWMTGISKNTVTKLLVDAGRAAAASRRAASDY
jgi:hypothetical protein